MVKRVCGGIFLARWGRFDGKKGLGAIFYERSYAITWGSLRIRSSPLPLCRRIPLWGHFLLGAFSRSRHLT